MKAMMLFLLSFLTLTIAQNFPQTEPNPLKRLHPHHPPISETRQIQENRSSQSSKTSQSYSSHREHPSHPPPHHPHPPPPPPPHRGPEPPFTNLQPLNKPNFSNRREAEILEQAKLYIIYSLCIGSVFMGALCFTHLLQRRRRLRLEQRSAEQLSRSQAIQDPLPTFYPNQHEQNLYTFRGGESSNTFENK